MVENVLNLPRQLTWWGRLKGVDWKHLMTEPRGTKGSNRNFVVAVLAVVVAAGALIFSWHTSEVTKAERLTAAETVIGLIEKGVLSTTNGEAEKKQLENKVQELQNQVNQLNSEKGSAGVRKVRKPHPAPISKGPQWDWADNNLPTMGKAVSYVERRNGQLW